MASKKVFDIIFKTKGLDKAKSGLGSLAGGLGRLAKGTAVAGAAFAALSVKLAGDFQKSLKEVGTLMGGLTKNEMKNMSRELRSLAQQSGLALSSLSKAKYDVVSAGFAGAADSAQILAATSKLAVGGVTSAANAADILTTALNAYGLRANQVNDVSDILFTTVKFGKTTMDELGASLGQVLPFARSAGLGLEGVGAIMASLTAGGIKTSEATTALRGALVALTSPAETSAKAMKAAGIEVKRFDDGSLDMVETIRQFVGMPPDAIRKFIPDVSAQLAVSALAQNIDGLAENISGFQERSKATEGAFEEMMGTFNNQMLSMRNTAQSIMIEVGQIIIDAILPSITDANNALQKMGEIGWDVVAQRLVDNLDTLGNIAEQAMGIIGANLGIVGQTIWQKLPWWMGGPSDEDALANIETAKRNISNRMDIINFEIGVMKNELTKPPELDTASWDTWKSDMDDMFAEMDMGGEIWTTPEEDLIPEIDGYTEALRRQKQMSDQAAKSEQTRKDEVVKSMEETAKAAALNASSAEDAAERVVRAAFMEALSRQIANIMAKIPFPFNLAVAAGVAGTMTGLFDSGMSQVKKLKLAQFGMDEVVSSPTLVMAGEAGPERIKVTPQGRTGSGGSGGITINFMGPVTSKDFVRDTIVPEFQRVSKLGLA